MLDLGQRICTLALATLLLGACAGNPELPPLPTVAQVDLQRYAGRWHEIARLPNRFQKGCSETTAHYALRDDGKVAVTNRCMTEGKEKIAAGKAKVVPDSGNAKLKVTFFWPFYGDYWIVDLAEDYSWVIVGTPSRDFLWILAREPRLPATTYAALLARLPAWGYAPEQLISAQD